MNPLADELDTRFTSWRKSTRSQGNDNQCVEVGRSTNAVGVRDSKGHLSDVVAFRKNAWASFLEHAQTL